jgi:hypothetical protein
MTSAEYKRAIKNLSKQTDLLTHVEAVITVKGHAWCMDVKSERGKMAKLFLSIFEEIKQ